jgi:hypothetical protein
MRFWYRGGVPGRKAFLFLLLLAGLILLGLGVLLAFAVSHGQ